MNRGSLSILPWIAAALTLGILPYLQFIGFSLPELDFIVNLVSHTAPGADSIKNIFTQPQNNYLITSTNYRPASTLILWLIHSVAGMNYSAYSTASIILHSINTALLFLLARTILGQNRDKLALATSIVFASHPLHLQTILFPSRMVEELMAFSLLTSMIAAIKYAETKNKKYLYLTYLTCTIGIFTKLTGILAPAIITVYLYATKKTRDLKNTVKTINETYIYAIIFGIYIILMLNALGDFGGYSARAKIPRIYSVINTVFGLNYPLDYLGTGLFKKTFHALQTKPIDTMVIALFIAGLGYAAIKNRENPINLALITWIAAFTTPFLITGFVINPWYLYTVSIAYLLLIAKKISENHKILKPAGILLFTSIILSSPIILQYPGFKASSNMLNYLTGETLQLAKTLPDNTSIHTYNYPEYITLTGRGHPYSVFMLNEGSLQALLDYHLPGKNLKIYGITSTLMKTSHLKNEYIMANPENCLITVEDQNPGKSTLMPSVLWVREKKGKQGVKYLKLKNRQQILYPKNTGPTAIFHFDGSRIQKHWLDEFCRPL